MKNFTKENRVLILGIALPFIIIIIFSLANMLPKLWVKPPQYNFIFATGYYYNPNQFFVSDGKLKTNCDKNCLTQGGRNVRLYLFDVKTKTKKEIIVNYSESPTTPNSTEIKIPEVENFTLDSSTTAPDGYQFVNNNSNDGNIATYFFNQRNNGAAISKEGNVILIFPDNATVYTNNIKFLGWIVKGN